MRLVPPLLVLTLIVAGCVAPETEQTDGDATPSEAVFATHALPAAITGLDPVASLDLGGGGNGIWIDEDRGLVLSSNGGGGFFVVDATDLKNLTELGRAEDVSSARDVDLIVWENRSYAVLAASADGIHVVDITDPADPVLVATANEYSAHNIASVPGTPYIYDSSGFAPEKLIPVLDITTPSDPVWHVIEIPATINNQPVQSDGCHDVVVRVDLARAYCAGGGSFYVAGGGETLIMDITDPLAPEWLGVIDNPSIMYHHQALASESGDLLFINDEFIAPNCQATDLPAGPRSEVGQSTAAMWIYDISDPAAPELLSWVQPSESPTSINCGSHFGDIIDGVPYVVWGWYGGGTLLIDVTDPTDPKILEQAPPANGSTWDARYWNGHVFSSSQELQVFRVV